MVPAPSQKLAVMGVDLGGTKMAYSVFPVTAGRVGDVPLSSGEVPTEKGIAALTLSMAQAYNASVAANSGHRIVAVGVGSPGRPLSTKNGAFVVAPTSAMNLESQPGELDHVDLQPVFQGSIPVPVAVQNDGIVQMNAMLTGLLQQKDRTQFYGRKIGYIGMGTGLGGGFAAVDKKGAITVHTDGHIDEICLDGAGQADRAEDILSGSGFTQLTGRHGQDITTAADAEAVRPALELMGRALAELVTKIHRGNFEKVDASANWSRADLDAVKGTSIFLMGGGVANNRSIMDVIEKTAQEELHKHGIHGISFVAVADTETTLAAANLVSPALLRPAVAPKR